MKPLKLCKTQAFCTFSLANVLLATAACNFSTSQLQKVVRTPQFFDFEMCFTLQRRAIFRSQLQKVVRTCSGLYILTSKCASCYSGVQFFDIATSKAGPALRCFVYFDLKMCFSLQRRAIFRHRNFEKLSEHGLFYTF